MLPRRASRRERGIKASSAGRGAHAGEVQRGNQQLVLQVKRACRCGALARASQGRAEDAPVKPKEAAVSEAVKAEAYVKSVGFQLSAAASRETRRAREQLRRQTFEIWNLRKSLNTLHRRTTGAHPARGS